MYDGHMSDVIETVETEDFYNPFHSKADGRFTFSKGGKRGKVHVPMSDNAKRSNALLRSIAAARRSKEYKVAQARVRDPKWANREKGQGGLRGITGRNSKRADTARAANAVKGAKTRTVGNPNKDGSEALKGAFKTTGNKGQDAIAITRLDRGSPERAKATAAFQKAYGGK